MTRRHGDAEKGVSLSLCPSLAASPCRRVAASTLRVQLPQGGHVEGTRARTDNHARRRDQVRRREVEVRLPLSRRREFAQGEVGTIEMSGDEVAETHRDHHHRVQAEPVSESLGQLPLQAARGRVGSTFPESGRREEGRRDRQRVVMGRLELAGRAPL